MTNYHGDKYINQIDSLSTDLDKYIKLLNEVQNFSLKINNKRIEIDFTDLIHFLKYSCFLTITHLDFLVILNSFSKANTKWEKTYYSKQGYLSIYESIKTYHIYNTAFRNVIKDVPLKLKNDYKELNKSLKEFKSKYDYENKISQIRNRVAGHYESDFDLYLENIKKINSDEIPELIGEFLEFQTSLIKFLDLVISKINK